MADDTNVSSTSEVVAPIPAETPAPKKQRAPRKQKVAAEATAVAAPVAKSPRGRRKKSVEQAVEVKPAVVEAPVAAKGKAKTAVKGTRKLGAAKQATKVVKAPVSASDDLLQLEEENQKLRKTLAEKLRTENADLRKRLGLA